MRPSLGGASAGARTEPAHADVSDVELSELLRTLPFPPYRRHRSVDGSARQQVLLGKARRSLIDAIYTSVVRDEDGLTGLATIVPLEWDTLFFGQTMMALDLLVGSRSRKQAAAQLLDRVIAAVPRETHLRLRLDAEDFELRLVAESHGFRVMDTICNFEHHPDYRSFPETITSQYSVRPYEPDDLAAVTRTAERCFRDFDSRFSRDPSIGPARAHEFYVTWARECCTGVMAERLLVAEHRGKVVSFLGWRLLPDLRDFAGLNVHGAGFGGCIPVRYGAYQEVLWHAVASLGGEPADFDTHLNNFASINTYQMLGFKLVGARHTLHCPVSARC